MHQLLLAAIFLNKGSTKKDLVYGNRVASFTFGLPSSQSLLLKEKVAALIRGYLCTICKSAQLATLRCIENKYKLNEFNSIFCTLRLRFQYIKFKITPRLKPEYFFKYFYIYPCNSGFFLL
uniref:Uncharacterized protein n=1 Tax=Bostrychia moritziana TaxID=103713 RepID=A0A1Z1M7L4_BOSMO|nr:hypothetical protein [Bostrychia moritziana]ARW61755.1 hypothetical protein [Bostrychia moritziana]